VKFIVGYQMTDGGAFADEIIAYRDRIREVYFSWGDMPSGRRGLSDDCGEILFEKQIRQMDDLKKLSAAGLHFNLLLNANCYGKDSQSRSFFYRIGNTVDFVQREFGLASVTTASPLIARFLQENFEGLDVRASVNMEIGTVEGLSYVADVFDSFYAKREFNRNLKQLHVLREWCDKNGKEMYLLANSGCLNNCSAHAFHDNLVAHEAEISQMDNGYDFRGVCWEFLGKPENKFLWLERTNFIRPEDIALYDGLVPAVKLATRVNRAPERVLRAYADRKYIGSVMELLEPNHSGAFYPQYIENSKIGKDFAKNVMNCDKNCGACGRCSEIMKAACVTLDDSPILKI
jgi:hypothetical protein